MGGLEVDHSVPGGCLSPLGGFCSDNSCIGVVRWVLVYSIDVSD